MKTIKLNKDKKYILGCSFGPDSMFLFDTLIKQKIHFVVAHVNYGFRKEASEETKNLIEYCKKCNIKIFTKFVKYNPQFGNFEARARNIRYDFFNEVSDDLNYKDVLIAHNLDDLLETYLLQKNRKGYVKYYGLNKKTKYKKVNIIRPMLNIEKKDILSYLNFNNIPYAIDNSNLDKKYQRNKIRYERVFILDTIEKEKILKEIDEKNKKLCNLQKNTAKLIYNDVFSLYNINEIDINQFQIIIYKLLENKKIVSNLSKKYIEDFFCKIKNKNGIFKITINKDYSFVKDYSLFYILKNRDFNYKYDINDLPSCIKLNKKSSLYLKLEINKKAKYVKNINKEEFYFIDGYKKKVNRIFIDRKMPFKARICWPGIYDSNDNIIYIPRYRENTFPNSNSLLSFNIDNLVK